MNLNSIPALQDNYIWILNDNQNYCLIVDPGESSPVIATIEQQQLKPVVILLTHYHYDHVGGIKELINKWPELIVYGPQETKNEGATHIVNGGDIISVLNYEFKVIFTPGHTLGHISYYSAPYLFCGDTIFSGGCGKLYKNSSANYQMYKSLQKIAKLPDETLICCAHEYTLSNLEFANTILPGDIEIKRYLQKLNKLHVKNISSLPTTLGYERQINLFLRIQDINLQTALNINTVFQSPLEIFSTLRQKKDDF